MKQTPQNPNLITREKNTGKEDNLHGYPQYPPGEDMYGKCQKDRKIDPEDPTNKKESLRNYKTGK